MARQVDIQYIRFYTDGSAARQIAVNPPRRKSKLPKVRRQKKKVVYVDPLAMAGIVVSLVMLILMTVGTVQLLVAHDQQETMEQYVQQLQEQNVSLSATYEASYELETVEKAALALGMIPTEQAQSMTIVLPLPEIVEEVTLWNRVTAFFEGMFA